MLGEHGHHVGVGVQDDGGEGGVSPLPGHDQDWFPRHTFVTSVGQTQGLGLLNEELNNLVVVRVWLNRGNSHVISEQCCCWILLGHSKAVSEE